MDTPKEEVRPKVERVIDTEVKTKKKSLGRKMAETFITDDIENVKSYIFFDVIVPTIKNAISDAITNGVDMLLFGETRTSRRASSLSGLNQKTSYSSYYNKSKTESTGRSVINRERYSADDVILGTRGEAEEVLNAMLDILDEYHVVSVADLYDLIGKTTNYMDNKYGWVDLSRAKIEPTRDGYFIRLPRTELIN